MASDIQVIPPPPTHVPFLSRDGMNVSPTWARWLDQMWRRGGKEIAMDNAELEHRQQEDLADILSDLSAIAANVAALQSGDSAQAATIALLQAYVDGLRLAPTA